MTGTARIATCCLPPAAGRTGVRPASEFRAAYWPDGSDGLLFPATTAGVEMQQTPSNRDLVVEKHSNNCSRMGSGRTHTFSWDFLMNYRLTFTRPANPLAGERPID